MSIATPVFPAQVTQALIHKQGFFPNNEHCPLLIYQSVFHVNQLESKAIINLLKQNNWGNTWIDSIYDYHHYHSNTHEVLVILSGTCQVIYGGPKGKIFTIKGGDVVIHPAGVSHKKIEATEDFICVGAYPGAIKYDMNYGKESEHPFVDEMIRHVGLPKSDPIFGPEGMLFKYWK